jgi:hypothetical protein
MQTERARAHRLPRIALKDADDFAVRIEPAREEARPLSTCPLVPALHDIAVRLSDRRVHEELARSAIERFRRLHPTVPLEKGRIKLSVIRALRAVAGTGWSRARTMRVRSRSGLSAIGCGRTRDGRISPVHRSDGDALAAIVVPPVGVAPIVTLLTADIPVPAPLQLAFGLPRTRADHVPNIRRGVLSECRKGEREPDHKDVRQRFHTVLDSAASRRNGLSLDACIGHSRLASCPPGYVDCCREPQDRRARWGARPLAPAPPPPYLPRAWTSTGSTSSSSRSSA